jgi:hypothetical protein
LAFRRGSIKAAASCTFSVSVTAAQTGTFQNTTSAVSSSAGAGSAGSAATLTVIPPPTVTVSHIKQNAKYQYGQVVKPTYSCTQPDDAAGLTDCSAEDDLGDTIASGGSLKTKIPGSHSLTVGATSDDGAVTTDEIDLHRAAEQPVHHREGQAQAPWRAPVPTCAPGRR